MATVFDHSETARSDWESGLLARSLLDLAAQDPATQRGLLKVWLPGMFNGAAAALDDPAGFGSGLFEWRPSSATTCDLLWHAPYGVSLALGRAYRQPNGSFAALVVAGVKDSMEEAMAVAEWAISRLAAAK